jgi:hypothetical protein
MNDIESLTDYAREDLDLPPRYHGTATVRNRGKKLAAEFWRGTEWSATAFGVERRDGSYRIPRDRLWEHEQTNGWIYYMSAVDPEIDLQDFSEALRLSRAVHAGRLDRRALRPTFAAVG